MPLQLRVLINILDAKKFLLALINANASAKRCSDLAQAMYLSGAEIVPACTMHRVL